MPRVAKCRRVCAEPLNRSFTPQRNTRRTTCITVEELEALRLCDLEGFDQETAAKQMDVSRGTFQRILYAARKKTASALVEGTGIRIEGGNYQVSSSCTSMCQGACRCCPLYNQENGQDRPKSTKIGDAYHE